MPIYAEKGNLSERIIRKATGLSPYSVDRAAGIPGTDLKHPV